MRLQRRSKGMRSIRAAKANGQRSESEKERPSDGDETAWGARSFFCHPVIEKTPGFSKRSCLFPIRGGIIHKQWNCPRKNSGSFCRDRISARDEVAGVEHGVESCTDTMVIVRTRGHFRVQADGSRYGLLADHCFVSWGLFAPRNPTVVATLFTAALSVSGAIFLILEMYNPYRGVIRISSAPLQSALALLGQ